MSQPWKALLEQVDDLKKVRRSTLTGPQKGSVRLRVRLFPNLKSFVIISYHLFRREKKGSCCGPWTTNWAPLQHKPNLVVNVAWSRKWALEIRWHCCLGVVTSCIWPWKSSITHKDPPNPFSISHEWFAYIRMNNMNNLLLQQYVTICIQWRGMDLQLENGTSDCRHPLGVIGIFGLDDLAANSNTVGGGEHVVS